MRLWSLHPKYLDARGLVALWREGLLAQKVLAGRTRGYTQHPQLARFKECSRPLAALARYLTGVWEEADRRGYQFDRKKIRKTSAWDEPLTVTRGQLQFEQQHLLAKLMIRAPQQHTLIKQVKRVTPHPLFRVVPGEREPWEQ